MASSSTTSVSEISFHSLLPGPLRDKEWVVFTFPCSCNVDKRSALMFSEDMSQPKHTADYDTAVPENTANHLGQVILSARGVPLSRDVQLTIGRNLYQVFKEICARAHWSQNGTFDEVERKMSKVTTVSAGESSFSVVFLREAVAQECYANTNVGPPAAE